METIGISIIIPTYNQAYFLLRAVASVFEQNFKEWEIIIINDASSDHTQIIIEDLIRKDERITAFKNNCNKGLGFCLNRGMKKAKFSLISYLPSDDIYYSDHLLTLHDCLINSPNAVLTYSGLKYDYKDTSFYSHGNIITGKHPDEPLQLVQVLHRKVNLKWTEREELVTDDLGRMFWNKLSSQGNYIPTGRVTAEWVSHPSQRHKLINELKGGGIYLYKQYYKVNHPIRYQSISGNYIDELKDYEGIKVNVVASGEKPLKILLVGELAYNPQRICALEEKGHKLYGLWMDEPYFYNTIGPLPFGNVEDIPINNWLEKVKEVKPDIIYALLNHSAVPTAYKVLTSNPGIPFVWHFKESPFFCRQFGIWNELIELYEKSDGQIYINEEMKLWFEQFLINNDSLVHILDGDLPLKYYFKEERRQRLSVLDGEIHTVIPGRPFGIQPNDMKSLAEQKVHVHLYGNYHHTSYSRWIQAVNTKSTGYLHLHPSCSPDNWSAELSQYDAGWLHVFQSSNYGETMKADWLDLNYPARMSTLAVAGLPMIQRNNAIHSVASQTIVKDLDIGVFFSTFEELGERLYDRMSMERIRTNCWNNRMHFSFDKHVDDLIIFFRDVIAKKNNSV